jgi:hypothetical protein
MPLTHATLPFRTNGPASTFGEIASTSNAVLLRFRPRFTVLADFADSTASCVALLDFRSRLALALASLAALSSVRFDHFSWRCS